MQKLPLGIQTFSKIRTEGYIYIDKTKYIFDLVTQGEVYFLSRPRRFGKSLLISTLESLFKGEKELFKGLWIYDQWEFRAYPVIKLDFSGKKIDKPQDLEDYISRLLLSIAADYEVAIDKNISYEEQFFFLIKELSKKERVVILIDEYDKPIVDYITNPNMAADNRNVLRAFYTVIKKADEYIRFIFLTGVSKFSKTSLFSGLNNLRDLTVEDQYSSMLGYTQKELEENFRDYLQALQEKESLDMGPLLQNIQDWYNGYSWDTRITVYNPYSILSLFLKGRFDNYWFATGTPRFLVELIREREFSLPELENLIVGSELLDSFDVEQMTLEALLFQTGYLTIKQMVRDGVRLYYKLNYPNYEVKESLLNHLLASYTDKPAGLSDIMFLYMRKDLEKRDIASFFEKLQGIISGIPYNIVVEKEAYYSSLIYTILALVGIRAEFEVQTAKGRLDAQIEFKDKVYLFEFKYDRPPKEAMTQIIKMGYFDKYRGKNKEIILIGVGFKREEKLIEYEEKDLGLGYVDNDPKN